MSLLPSTDYSLLTALERELGRPRVKAMAESYLYATMSATGPTVHSPLSSPRMSPSRDPSQLGYTMEGCPSTPPARPSLTPPGAPARLSRAARPVLNPEDDEDASPLPSLVIPPPPPPPALPSQEDPRGARVNLNSVEDCPRHSRIASAGFGLRRSSNPPEGNGCSRCVREQARTAGIYELWELYGEAQRNPCHETIERGRLAFTLFMELYPEYDNMDLSNNDLGLIDDGLTELARQNGM